MHSFICLLFLHVFIYFLLKGTEKFCPTTARRAAGGCFPPGDKRVDLGLRGASACPPARASSTPPWGATLPSWFTWLTWVMWLKTFWGSQRESVWSGCSFSYTLWLCYQQARAAMDFRQHYWFILWTSKWLSSVLNCSISCEGFEKQFKTCRCEAAWKKLNSFKSPWIQNSPPVFPKKTSLSPVECIFKIEDL